MSGERGGGRGSRGSRSGGKTWLLVLLVWRMFLALLRLLLLLLLELVGLPPLWRLRPILQVGPLLLLVQRCLLPWQRLGEIRTVTGSRRSLPLPGAHVTLCGPQRRWWKRRWRLSVPRFPPVTPGFDASALGLHLLRGLLWLWIMLPLLLRRKLRRPRLLLLLEGGTLRGLPQLRLPKLSLVQLVVALHILQPL